MPGVVQSRIHIANGRTNSTPLRKSGEAVSAGFDHVIDGHFNRALGNSRYVFSITVDELKIILQRRDIIHSAIERTLDGQFKRVVNTGKFIGRSALKEGGEQISWITIFTDSKGNLITTYPVKGN